MKLDQNKYILTNKEKQALIWRIEHYKQPQLSYLPLNHQISPEMKDILAFVEELANNAAELQRCMTVAAVQEIDNIQATTTLKLQKQEKERHARGGLAKGQKNKLFKDFVLQEYDKNNDYPTIKEFVNNIVDRLNNGEFEHLKPCFKTTTPETTIRNWITEHKKQKNIFRAK